MATITVRNLDDEVQHQLKQRAAANGQSMEAEAREILTAAVAGHSMIADWVDAAVGLTFELELPPRSAPRVIELS